MTEPERKTYLERKATLPKNLGLEAQKEGHEAQDQAKA